MFGVRIPNDGRVASPNAFIKIAQKAEELGFDSVWTHDNLISGAYEKGNPQTPFYDPLVTLTYVAPLTQSIRLGTAVLILPLRHPMVLAKQVATLDILSKGRVTLGVGLGYMVDEYKNMKIPWNSRGAIANESLAALKALWSQSPVNFSGKYFQFNNFEMYPRPLQKPGPPIWIGGASEAGDKRLWKYGEGRIFGSALGHLNKPDEMKKRILQIKAMAPRYNRNASEIQFSKEWWVCLGDSQEKAVTRAFAVPMLESRFKTKEQLEQDNLIGVRRDVVQKIEAALAAGMTHFQLRFFSERTTLEEFIEQMIRFKDEVLPSFSKLSK